MHPVLTGPPCQLILPAPPSKERGSCGITEEGIKVIIAQPAKQSVVAALAMEDVIPAATQDLVPVKPPLENIVSAVTDQGVGGMRISVDIFYTDQSIAFGFPA